jgi:alpha-tubulin suppressor-like RCC1 family protein
LIRRHRLQGYALAALLCGCNQALDVLTLTGTTAPDAGPVREPDAGGSAGAPVETSPPCSDCQQNEVCVSNRCVAQPNISAGGQHTCGVASGALACWGDNSSGELGTGDTADKSKPVRVGGRSVNWMVVAAGAHHTCGLRMPGELWCWGDNSQAQLGLGNTNPMLPVTTNPNNNGMQTSGTRSRAMFRVTSTVEDYTHLHCGGDNCCVRRSTGALLCWGANSNGNTGTGKPTSGPVTMPTPVALGTSFSGNFSVGGEHTCAIRSDGALLCWGRNNHGQLGDGAQHASEPAPIEVGTNRDWLRVAAGGEHTCGIRAGNTLSCWGGNEYLQLGIGRDALDGAPLVAEIPNNVDNATDWRDIAAGGFHTCGTKLSGELLCWGHDDVGQVGNGMNVDAIDSPAAIMPPNAWTQLALGAAHSCGFDTLQQLFCWGDNAQSQLGLGDQRARNTPTEIMP